MIVMGTFLLLAQKIGRVLLVLFLGFCVVGQILGSPTTLSSVLTADLSKESVSEDLSIAPTAVHISASIRLFAHYEQPSPSLYSPTFLTALLRPPQA